MPPRSSRQKADSAGTRVQKYLADAGIASRRQADRLVVAGRVLIDGRTAQPGDRLTGAEDVRVDGRRVRLRAVAVRDDVLLYHKPAGQITSRRDPERRPSVFESLPPPPKGRWISVGRLDFNSSGLLLFTTDGELAHRLMHPRYEVERIYVVRVRGELDDVQLESLRNGIDLDDGQVDFQNIETMADGKSNCWYRVHLREGRNREIRRAFEAVGATVGRLLRISYGPIELGRLKRGRYRSLDEAERARLYQSVGLSEAGRPS